MNGTSFMETSAQPVREAPKRMSFPYDLLLSHRKRQRCPVGRTTSLWAKVKTIPNSLPLLGLDLLYWRDSVCPFRNKWKEETPPKCPLATEALQKGRSGSASELKLHHPQLRDLRQGFSHSFLYLSLLPSIPVSHCPVSHMA